MDLKTAVRRYNRKRPTYDTFRAYSRGNHQLKFVDPSFAKEYPDLKSIRENLCGAVIDSFVDKLSVESWGNPANDKIADELGLARILNVAESEAFRCGTAYIILAKRPDGTDMPITQRADQVVAVTDEFALDRIGQAFRFWIDSDNYPRISHYYDDIWVQDLMGTQPMKTDDNGVILDADFPEGEEQWQELSNGKHGYRVTPVLQYKQGSQDAFDDGLSILTDVIPLQDALNKELADSIVLSSSYARPFWYLLNYMPKQVGNPLLAAQQLATALGQLTPDQIANYSGPEEGSRPTDPSKFDRTRQKIFTSDSPGPMGQLDPPDIIKLLDVQDRFALKIARVVGMPSYYLTQTSGDVPSGASLRVLAERMTARVGRFQLDAEPVNKGLGELLGMQNVSIDWKESAPLDELERVTIANVKLNQLGYTMEDAITVLSEPDAADIVKRARAEKEANKAEMVGLDPAADKPQPGQPANQQKGQSGGSDGGNPQAGRA